MDFKACPRAVWRPKKKRFGGPSILKSARLDLNSASINDNPEQPKRKRYRPKGSKNLPKVSTLWKEAKVDDAREGRNGGISNTWRGSRNMQYLIF